MIFICSKERTLLRESDDVSIEKKRKIRISFGETDYRAVSPRQGSNQSQYKKLVLRKDS